MKKILSILMLCALTTGVQAKKHNHCCNKKKFVEPDLVDRSFCTKLSFEQELVESPLSPYIFVPTSTTIPESFAPQVCGRLELCFAKDLSSVDYKLFVFGAPSNNNPKEQVTQAHLHAGRASQNGPIIAFLYPDPNLNPGFTCADSKAVNGLLAQGTLTNAEILPVESLDGNFYNSIASLFDGIRRGEVYVNVHGVEQLPSGCDTLQQGFEQGLIRGQILTEKTSG